MTAKRPTLTVRPDGSYGLLDTAGKPIADQAPIVSTAGEIASVLGSYTAAGYEIGRKVGTKAAAQVGARLLQETVAAANESAAKAATAGAQAGVTAGARWAIANSRVRRKVVRDPSGLVTGTVEVREPDPVTAPPRTRRPRE